ncbi:MAG: DNA polymerase/3'-5' exonuclease PolX [Bacillota bacterium]|nr:DNA polymerase/3'-5' exonuclease PolX [Bacillota bacterium]
MEKQLAVAKILEEIGTLLELKGENPFKSRAYFSAARTVEMLGEEELERLINEDKLQGVKGIGSALDDKLKELVLTGNLSYYEELKASVPDGLLEILKIPGLGPRKVKALYDTLSITTLAELEYACRENRLINLKGFGLKTQENILEGIEFLRRNQGRYYVGEARRIGENFIAHLREFPTLGEVSLAGSVRRFREIVKDIDIVASADEPDRLTRFVAHLPVVDEIIALGDTKVTVRLKDGINVDLRAVKREQFPCALHHFTGSKEHNTALRSRARKMGLKINEYGLFRDGELIVCRDEKEFFAALGLDWIPPELRENNGEIEAAELHVLPELIEKKDIRGIFHVHSIYSDGTANLEDIVRHCLDAGYEYVGITDHSQSAFYAGGLKEEDLKKQAEEIDVLRGKYNGIAILRGIESDIRVDGSLDYPDEVLEKLDFVIASVHSGLFMERTKMTTRILKALAHPFVTMLGHPTNRLLLGREGSHLDLEQVFKAARDYEVILELNANPARLDLDWRHLKKIKKMGVPVSINPDVHRLADFDHTGLGISLARKGWLEKENVFNTRSRAEIESYLHNRRLSH